LSLSRFSKALILASAAFLASFDNRRTPCSVSFDVKGKLWGTYLSTNYGCAGSADSSADSVLLLLSTEVAFVLFVAFVEFVDSVALVFVLFFLTSSLTYSSNLSSAFLMLRRCERVNSNCSVSFGVLEPFFVAMSELAISVISSKV